MTLKKENSVIVWLGPGGLLENNVIRLNSCSSFHHHHHQHQHHRRRRHHHHHHQQQHRRRRHHRHHHHHHHHHHQHHHHHHHHHHQHQHHRRRRHHRHLCYCYGFKVINLAQKLFANKVISFSVDQKKNIVLANMEYLRNVILSCFITRV